MYFFDATRPIALPILPFANDIRFYSAAGQGLPVQAYLSSFKPSRSALALLLPDFLRRMECVRRKFVVKYPREPDYNE